MKKLINRPENVVDELIEGFVLANEHVVTKLPGVPVVVRKDAPVDGKVGIVVGGRSVQEPLFMGYVGSGLADAAVQGNISAAPDPDWILQAIHAVDSGSGVLLLYNNYAGDRANFDMAQEMARNEGIQVETIRINDEIDSVPRGSEVERRGTTADPVIIKVAGAVAEMRESLHEVARVTRKVVLRSRSLGFVLESGSLRGEYDEQVEQMLQRIIDDLPFVRGDEVILIINGYGGASEVEMLIVNRKVRQMLSQAEIGVYITEVGEFCASQETKGISVTLTKVDDELKMYYDQPCQSACYVRMPWDRMYAM